MRKRLRLALMATPVIATFLSLTPCVQAEAGSDTTVITPTTDDYGRTIYVNESVPAAPGRHSDAPARRDSLMFWSTVEHRWKPVPSANVRAARSAERCDPTRRSRHATWLHFCAIRPSQGHYAQACSDIGHGLRV